jgi:L,D-peptidoglycan transpeptidase YkuD (ErfK/YbiS/YcfS/YnhG family)
MGTQWIAEADSGRLSGGDLTMACVFGRSGVVAAHSKREGDGASPAGVWPVRAVLYRPDRWPSPPARLCPVPLARHDGWCDAPTHPLYNRPVSLPFRASHEELWRADGVYDVIVVLGHNDDPVTLGAGSAIFWHLTQPDRRRTEGCVAIDRDDMGQVLNVLSLGDTLRIVGG